MANRKKRKAEYIDFLNGVRLCGGFAWELKVSVDDNFNLVGYELEQKKVCDEITQKYKRIQIGSNHINVNARWVGDDLVNDLVTVMHFMKTKVTSGRIKKLR